MQKNSPLSKTRPPRDHQICKYLIKNKWGEKKENKQDLKDIYQGKNSVLDNLKTVTISPWYFFKKYKFDCKIARKDTQCPRKSNTDTYCKAKPLNFKDKEFFGELCKITKSLSKEKNKADLRFPKSKFPYQKIVEQCL